MRPASPRLPAFHCWNRSCKMVRYSPVHKRWRLGWKCPAMGPKAERKRCACLTDLNLRIFFSRSRVGWCEFSARLFKPLCCVGSATRISSTLCMTFDPHERIDVLECNQASKRIVNDASSWWDWKGSVRRSLPSLARKTKRVSPE